MIHGYDFLGDEAETQHICKVWYIKELRVFVSCYGKLPARLPKVSILKPPVAVAANPLVI